MRDSYLDVYDKCFDDVYRYVVFRVGSKWDADDIVSEVFMKAYQGYESQRGDRRAWVFTIARNCVIDFYRRNKREVKHADLSDIPMVCHELDTLENKVEADCLREALEQLDQDQRELISLRYFAGLPHRQVAEVLGRTEGAVKMRISRVLEKVKGLVEACIT